jgi:hypothetical protein
VHCYDPEDWTLYCVFFSFGMSRAIPVTLVCYLQGVNFYTEVKTVTQLWRESDVSHSRAAVSMPVMQ